MSESKTLRVKATFPNHTSEFDVLETPYNDKVYTIINSVDYDGFSVNKSICEILPDKSLTKEELSDLEYKHLAGIVAMGEMTDNHALAACVHAVMFEYHRQHPELVERITEKKAEIIPNKDSNKEDLQAALNHAYELIAEFKAEIIELRVKVKPNYWPTTESIIEAANLQADSLKDNAACISVYYAFIRGIDWVKAELYNNEN